MRHGQSLCSILRCQLESLRVRSGHDSHLLLHLIYLHFQLIASLLHLHFKLIVLMLHLHLVDFHLTLVVVESQGCTLDISFCMLLCALQLALGILFETMLSALHRMNISFSMLLC